MATITIKKTQSVTDIYTTRVEVSTDEFPELLSDDFSFDNMSEELKYYLEREDSDDMEMDNLNIFAFEKL
jgi:thymidylate synthase